jgi:hypothetical protein
MIALILTLPAAAVASRFLLAGSGRPETAVQVQSPVGPAA